MADFLQMRLRNITIYNNIFYFKWLVYCDRPFEVFYFVDEENAAAFDMMIRRVVNNF